MLDFRMNTFIAVCKYLNFTKAAEELNITQPAVSQHIRHLQEEYQVPLFHHIGKKIKLTKEGEILLNAATTLKHDEIFLRNRLLEESMQKHTLVFGATLTVGQYVVLDNISKYLNLHPETSINIHIANTEQLLRGINEGHIDFAMVEGYFEKNEYDSLLYAREPFIAICSGKRKPFPSPCNIEDLFKEKIILREEGSGSRDILEHYLQERNYTSEDFYDQMEINNIQAIISCVQANCGITFLYKAAVLSELASGSVQEIPIKDADILHDITFIWRKKSIFSHVYKTFFEELSAFK